jgi:four helix bundle protein
MQEKRSYRNLLVWQKAIDISQAVYTLTKSFPRDEQFALTSQMRRAAVSIAANIAEGYGRNGNKEFASFLRISHGSLTELETLLTIAKKLSYCDEKACSTIEEQLDETGRMLYALRAKLH